jgi:NAD(P)-dependent dehydrogenase (short-subunit alcohol dehydrogenase family)
MTISSPPPGSELAGTVAIVTGAAMGIGRAIAVELASAGASVVIADLSGADKTAAELAEEGYAVSGVEADVTSESATEQMAAHAVQTFGGIDVLVNNAGIFAALTPRPFDQITVEEWRRVMDINVLGCFLSAKAVVPAMRARGGGRIINIGSTSQFKGTPWLLHYVSSKGAVGGFTRALARELGAENILVNAVAPGFTISAGVIEHAEQEERMRLAAPGARVLQRDMVPEDVMGAVRFFAGPLAPFITGQTLVIDGGAFFH